MPDRYKQTTKEQFFAIMGPRDVHPWPEPDKTLWRLRNLDVIGITTPGYLCQGEKTYSILASLLTPCQGE